MTLAVHAARCVFDRRRAPSVVALDGVDLEVGAGELVVVVGPSGSGKSTLLRAVAGLVPLASGRVEIGGRDVTHEPPGRRDVSMVFQDYALLPHLTVAGNVAFGERARGTGRDAAERKVRAAAKALDLGELLDRRPDELSGGQRQRVALARALVREPAAFLLDEPLSGLDAELRLRARAETRALQRRLGVAMLHVTHDAAEATALADRIVVLRAGRVEQVGTPDELHERPATTFVARFAGALPMNLLPAQDGHVGVTPERTALVPPGTGSAQGRVLVVEPRGDEVVVHVDVAGSRVLAVAPRSSRPAEGAPVGLSWRATDEHRFGPDGRRVG